MEELQVVWLVQSNLSSVGGCHVQLLDTGVTAMRWNEEIRSGRGDESLSDQADEATSPELESVVDEVASPEWGVAVRSKLS